MLVTVLYQTSVTVEGGRDGHVIAADQGLELTLATPAGLGGADGPGTNPEQLLGVAYAANFLSAIQFVASQGGGAVSPDSTVMTDIAIGPWSQGGFGLAIGLDVRLPDLSLAEAMSLVRRADRICPFSSASCGGTLVRVTLAVEGVPSVIVTTSQPRARKL